VTAVSYSMGNFQSSDVIKSSPNES